MSRTINKVAVLGAGVMGAGIAAHCANAGLPCVLLDIVPPNLTDEERKLKANRDRFALNGLQGALKAKPAAFFSDKCAKLVTTGNFDDDLALLKDCDLIVECVVENLDIKRNLFKKVADVRKPDGIVTTNTSGLPLAKILEGFDLGFKQHFMVTHFFNPPRYMKLLELVCAPETLPAVAEKVAVWAVDRMGKGVVWGKDTPNFVANRIGVYSMFCAMQEMETFDLSIGEVDAIAGPPMGRPKTAAYKTVDLVGLDTLKHIGDFCYANLGNDEEREVFKVPSWFTKMVENKWLGNKTKGGFYKKDKSPDGKKIVYEFDWHTCDYKLSPRVESDLLTVAKNTEELGERINGLITSDEKYGQFAWKTLSRTLAYTARRLGEIADDVVNIDNGMKWGFNWSKGPFETWDAIGVAKSVERMKADGLAIAPVVEAVLTKGEGTWYKYDAKKGQRLFFDIKTNTYLPEPQPKTQIVIQYAKDIHEVVYTNSSASLINIGDDVLLLEFHSKMNAIDGEIVEAMNYGTNLLNTEDKWNGMVVTNQADNFSVGANLMLLWMASTQGEWESVKGIVKGFQYANKAMRYAKKPVVVAPFGMTLGGGCEVCLGGDAILAHSELYMGLVEVGVGLLPGGGGTKELLIRYLEGIPPQMNVDRFPYVQKVFELIGMAKVSFSAELAREMRILRATDRVILNRDRLVHDAKQMVLGMAIGGYTPPKEPDFLILPGEEGIAAFKVGLDGMRHGGYISEHDEKVATKVAEVLCGGYVRKDTLRTEDELLELELEAFMSLCGEPKSQERMIYMLQKNKPLRN
jgi:3-hydroxyacyl-CoA dehydrogenase